MSKRAPDEFAVVRRAPLIVPPDYDLRPPDPGAPRPMVGRTADQARMALTRSQAEPGAAAQVLAGATPSGQATSRSATGTASDGVPASAIADDLLSAGTNIPNNASTPPPATASTAAAAPPAAAAAASASADGAGETPGEMAMVALAGGNQADPDVRRQIAEENQALADVESSLFTRIVNWREPSSMGATIDAPAEAQRLRDNKSAGRAPTEGDTPTVVNRRQSALQGLFEDIF